MSKAKSEKPAPKTGKSAANPADYIDHEQVVTNHPAVQEVVEVDILPEEQLKQEIAKLNLAEAGIEQLKQEFGALVISGPDDKEGYRKVKDAWQLVRSKRTGLEKRGLEIRNRFTFITKGVKKEEDRLVELLTPLEEDLQAKWKAIDDEKEKAKKAKEEEENRQLMARLEELVGLGMKLVDGFYTLGDTISMDVATLRALPADQYDKLKQTVQVRQNELAEQARLKAEEEEKERLRLKQQQDDLEKEQEKLKEEKEQLMLERREVRVGKLESLGMTLRPVGKEEIMSYGDDVKIMVADMLELSAGEFSELMEELGVKITELKEAADREKKALETKEARIKHLLSLGMTYAQKADLFKFDNGHKTVSHGGAKLFELDDYGFQEHAKVLGDLIREANEAKDQHDNQVAEEKRQLEVRMEKIATLMQATGTSYNYNDKAFVFANPQGGVVATWNDLLPLTDEQLQAKVASVTTEIAGLKKQEETAKKSKEEQERKEKQQGMKDKERYELEHAAIADAATKMIPGEFKTKKYQQRAQQFLERLTNLLKEFE